MGILEKKPHDPLVTATRNVVEEVFKCLPVVLIFPSYDSVEPKIAELHRMRKLFVLPGIRD